MTVVKRCPTCGGAGDVPHFIRGLRNIARSLCPQCHGDGIVELAPTQGKSPEQVENEKLEEE